MAAQLATRRRRVGFLFWSLATIALIAVEWPSVGARAQRGYAIADLEAAIIDKIVDFVRWPGDAAESGDAKPFLVTVLGASELTPRLRLLFDKRVVAGRAARVREVTSASEIDAPHVLFVERTFEGELSTILASLDDKPVLTIGHAVGFARRGVAINLFVDRGRVRFEINRRALSRARLTASYQLLSLARLVEEG